MYGMGDVPKGGVVFIGGDSTEVKMDSVLISMGTVTTAGGGIYDSLGALILNNCTIENCRYSKSAQGGGIYNLM
jgi:alkyl hydroperoxide reductase subunit AhpF